MRRPNPKAIDAIGQAKCHSLKELKNYSPGWINAEMDALNNQGCEDLFQSSINQGVVLFQSPSLKVYAADWRYQLASKISKAFDKKEEIKHTFGISERERVDRWTAEGNMLDAVAILRRLLDLRGHALNISEIRKWFYFGSTFTRRAVDSINKDFSVICQTRNVPIIHD
ncbi:hypothetical protein M413DRAFT_10953 [Hebeloma cylindrosporum]|uniref:Uncharacterized protein n=1 Tax=Hebeloma cylindrosporum TaxID=76867 RepID=A0A0C3BXL4_HEBCY|nr:hypothetical protein M413DRAFT_10953 [Hebeloma cylindrosporum h7]